MNCPFCNAPLTGEGVCTSCGADAILFYKIRNASNRLYNKGLLEAKSGNLSDAIQALEQSVTFDKVNIKARNLLGLTYYEVGQVADALKQWIISSSLIKENNPAKKYIDALQKNARELEKYDDSIHMYNNAIVYLRQKSGDLAIIQLKKATDLNPKFLEAYNLLTLCYIMGKNFNKAIHCIDKVLSMDINNKKALYYSREISNYKSSKSKQTQMDNEMTPSPTNKISSYHRPEKSRVIIGRTEIISFFVGIICTTAVLMTLIVPAWVEGKDQKISDLTSQITKLQSANSTGSNQNSVSFKELQAENETLKAEIEKYKENEILQEKINKIEKALNLNTQGDTEAAALLIMEVDPATLPDDELAKYNSVKENAYPKAAQSFYQKGKTAFLNNNYDEAVGSLENSLKFASGGEVFVDDSIYYLGKIAQSKGDNEKAKTYFQRIINEFPDSNQYRNAENSLNSLES